MGKASKLRRQIRKSPRGWMSFTLNGKVIARGVCYSSGGRYVPGGGCTQYRALVRNELRRLGYVVD